MFHNANRLPALVAMIALVALLSSAAFVALLSTTASAHPCDGNEGTVIQVPAHKVTDNPNVDPNKMVPLGCASQESIDSFNTYEKKVSKLREKGHTLDESRRKAWDTLYPEPFPIPIQDREPTPRNKIKHDGYDYSTFSLTL